MGQAFAAYDVTHSASSLRYHTSNYIHVSIRLEYVQTTRLFGIRLKNQISLPAAKRYLSPEEI